MKTVKLKVRQAEIKELFTADLKLLANQVFFIKSLYTQKIERAYSSNSSLDIFETYNMCVYGMLYVQERKTDKNPKDSKKIEITLYNPENEHIRGDDVYFIEKGHGQIHRLARCFANQIDVLTALDRGQKIFLQKYISAVTTDQLKETA